MSAKNAALDDQHGTSIHRSRIANLLHIWVQVVRGFVKQQDARLPKQRTS